MDLKVLCLLLTTLLGATIANSVEKRTLALDDVEAEDERERRTLDTVNLDTETAEDSQRNRRHYKLSSYKSYYKPSSYKSYSYKSPLTKTYSSYKLSSYKSPPAKSYSSSYKSPYSSKYYSSTWKLNWPSLKKPSVKLPSLKIPTFKWPYSKYTLPKPQDDKKRVEDACRSTKGCTYAEVRKFLRYPSSSTTVKNEMKNMNCKSMTTSCPRGSVCAPLDVPFKFYLTNKDLKVCCKRDGYWGSWGQWGSCSKSCGRGGIQKRTRTLIRPQCNGRSASGNSVETRSCTNLPCKVDGGWSSWSTGKCSATCGKGTIRSYRFCSNPLPSFGGKRCEGPDSKTEPCLLEQCKVNGGWSAWSKIWSSCSAKCGNGTTSRLRFCNNPPAKYGGDDCKGSRKETKVCNLGPCPVNGGWSKWSAYSSCSAECGDEGFKTKTRTCTNPAPAFKGKPCWGYGTSKLPCNRNVKCPIEGGLSEWGDWTVCSAACGPGTQTRSKTCTNPSPANGGKPCEGKAKETRTCNERVCQSEDMKGGLLNSCVQSDSCKVTYRKVESLHSEGAIKQPSIKTTEECMEKCSTKSDCMGIDYDETDVPYDGARCWLTTLKYSPITGVDYYQKRNFITEDAGASTYMKYINYHAEGSDGQKDAQTLDACSKACSGTKNCLAYDFDRTDNPWKGIRCWLHQSSLTEWTDGFHGHHYQKIPCPIQPISEVEP